MLIACAPKILRIFGSNCNSTSLSKATLKTTVKIVVKQYPDYPTKTIESHLPVVASSDAGEN